MVRTNRFEPIRNQPSPITTPTTPRDIYTSTDDLEEISTKERYIKYIVIYHNFKKKHIDFTSQQMEKIFVASIACATSIACYCHICNVDCYSCSIN